MREIEKKKESNEPLGKVPSWNLSALAVQQLRLGVNSGSFLGVISSLAGRVADAVRDPAFDGVDSAIHAYDQDAQRENDVRPGEQRAVNLGLHNVLHEPNGCGYAGQCVQAGSAGGVEFHDESLKSWDVI